jgi:hypothetical protein
MLQAISAQDSPGVSAHTGIDVDTSDAPRFVRITLGQWPSLERQRAIRDRLVLAGRLTPESRLLCDLRHLTAIDDGASLAALTDGPIARVQAYLVSSVDQHQLARRYKHSVRGSMVEIFLDEREALLWLWNAGSNW